MWGTILVNRLREAPFLITAWEARRNGLTVVMGSFYVLGILKVILGNLG